MALARREPTDVVPWDSHWKQIKNFPEYWINQYGHVIHLKLRRMILPFERVPGKPLIYLTKKRKNGRTQSTNRNLDMLVQATFGEKTDGKTY